MSANSASNLVQISTADPDDFSSLMQWLLSDTDTKRLNLETRAATTSEQMSGAEILTIVLDSGGLIATLGAIRTWIKYRQPSIKLKLQSKDGRVVEVDATNAGSVDEIAKALNLDER